MPEPQKPSEKSPLVDPLLGTLEWDDTINWYCGEVQVATASFDLILNADEVPSALLRAKQIVENFEQYRKMIAEYAVEGLLELKNDVWLGEDEKEFSAEEFKAKMTLKTITVESDGDVIFWHHDGDLFWGHSIMVCIDASDNCTDIDIPG